MRTSLIALAILGATLPGFASSAQAAVIVGLYNSGVDSGGDGWAAGGGAGQSGGADLHWSNGGAQAFTGSLTNSAWLANSATSRWVTPTPDARDSLDPWADGEYVYSLAFDLSGYDASTASFAGRFSTDNLVTAITLNGQAITGGGGSFDYWTDFSSLSGAFVGGVNVLSFNVTNFAQASGNPTGLRVEFLSSNVEQPMGPVPEPSTWAMMIVGFGVIGAVMRRSRLKLGHYV